MTHIRLYVRPRPGDAWSRAGNCWCPEEAAREAGLLLPDVSRWEQGQIGAKVVDGEFATDIFVIWPRPGRLAQPEP